MKKIIIGVLVAVVVIVGISLGVAFAKMDTLVKQGFETVGPKLTKVEMKLGSAKISPFSGKGELHEIFIGNPENFKTPSAIKVGTARMGVNIKSLASGVIEVDEIFVEAPELTFEGSLKGSNLSKILENIEASVGASGDSSSKDSGSSEKKFFVKDFQIKNGKVNLSMTILGGKAMTVPLPDIHLTDIGSKDKGVTAAELAKQVMSQVMANTTKAVTGALASVGKEVTEIGKGAVDAAGKAAEGATKGIKSLFKK